MLRSLRSLPPFAAFIALTTSASLATQSVIAPQRLAALSWRTIGPFRGGRVSSIAGVPSAPHTFYMAPDNGGVWKTTDAGRTWQPLFDAQSTQSIGAIAVAPSDPRVVYAGSGEGLQRPDLSVGNGMYVSHDAGATWRHLGLRDGQQVAKIAVDPRDARRLFVAVLGHPYGPNAKRGVYRSTDGGGTFTRVLGRGPDTGAFDVAIAPGDGRIVYASLWSARWPPWMAFGSLERPQAGTGLYRSIDGGTTWKPLTRGLPRVADGIGRSEVAVAPGDPNRVYAAVDARTGGGIFRSDDAGASWRRTNNEDRITERGDDLANLAVDAHDRDDVWFTNTSTYRSRDGGRTFVAVKGAPGGDDYHAVWLSPHDRGVVALASDQGATISLNGGGTWSSWYNQPTAQFFHVSADDRFPYWVYGGQQESGSVGIASRGNDGAVTFRDWHPVGAEEYGYVAPDPLHPGVVFGGKGQRFDMATGQVRDVSPVLFRGTAYRYDRTAPMIFSHADPHVLYLAANVVFATSDGGVTWRTISPDLTRAKPGLPETLRNMGARDPGREEHRGVVYALGPSYRNVGVLWAGTNDGYVWRTRDGGATWGNVTPGGVDAWSKVTQIDASPFDDETAYVSVSRFLLDDLRPYVYVTHDAGGSWSLLTRGLPADAPVNAVRADPVRRGLLYAATERGVDVSFDDAATWQPLQANLPATSVRDLVVHANDLVIATHGRSFWIMDDVAALRQMTLAAPQAAHLYTPPDAIRVRRDTNTDTPLPPEESAGQNPPDGAVLDYELARPARAVALEVADERGNVVRRYANSDAAPVDPPLEIPSYWVAPFASLATGAGMHRFVWDLHADAPRVEAHAYPISAIAHGTPREPLGPLVPPGSYRATLVVDGLRQSVPLSVRPDPRVTATASDYFRQYEVATRIANLMTTSTESIARLRKTPADAGRMIATPASRVQTLADALPRVQALFDSVEGADAAPTAVQIAELTELLQLANGTQ